MSCFAKILNRQTNLCEVLCSSDPEICEFKWNVCVMFNVKISIKSHKLNDTSNVDTTTRNRDHPHDHALKRYRILTAVPFMLCESISLWEADVKWDMTWLSRGHILLFWGVETNSYNESPRYFKCLWKHDSSTHWPGIFHSYTEPITYTFRYIKMLTESFFKLKCFWINTKPYASSNPHLISQNVF